MTGTPINATLKVKLRPWRPPNFALRFEAPDNSEAPTDGIPIAELDDATLLQLADAWLTELYRKAGRRGGHPFYHADAMARDQ